MAKQITVMAGDTLNKIAQKENVSIDSISGFRSGDPNQIFPGEVLNIADQLAPDATQEVDPTFSLSQEGNTIDQNLSGTQNQTSTDQFSGAPILPATGEQTVEQQQTGFVTGDEALASTLGPGTTVDTSPEAEIAPVDDVGDPTLDTTTTDTTTSTEDILGDQVTTDTTDTTVVSDTTPEQDKFSEKVGTTSKSLQEMMETDPIEAIKGIMEQVLDFDGLAETNEQIRTAADEIEELENQLADKIEEINDDPFKSAITKSRLVQKQKDKFDQRINARVNKLNLLQGLRDEARQQAQFAATTGISLFGKQEMLKRNDLDRILAQQELEREAIVNAENEQFDREMEIAGFNQKERELALKIRKEFSSDTGFEFKEFDITTPTGQLGSAAQNLLSKFGSKFQRDSFVSNVNRLSQTGDDQTLADYIFSEAISQLPDSEGRKKAFSQYKITKKLDFLENQLALYAAQGGDTGKFRGTVEDIKASFGQVGDPELRSLGIAIADTLDGLARDRTGAVLSDTETEFYDSILPSTRKTADLNTAIIDGLKSSLTTDLNSALSFQLSGSGFQSIEPFLGGSQAEIPKSEFADETQDIVFANEPSASDADQGWFGDGLVGQAIDVFTNFFNK